MPWFNVDDGFHSHPKVLATPLSARGLWVTAGSWCSRNLTDGFVPSHVLASLGGTPELAEALVTAGLWKRRRNGYYFHDWTGGGTRNKTRAEVEEMRAKKADAGRKGGLASAKARSKPQAGASPRADAVVEPHSLSSYRAKSAANGRAPTGAANRRKPEPKPAWCGQCDETTRQRENPQNGLPMRCPACHPLTERHTP